MPSPPNTTTASTNSTSDSGNTTNSTSATTTDTGDGDSAESGTKWDLPPIPDASEGCAGGGGGGNQDLLSFIWIANSGEGTVSKINTMTGVEEGRYDSSPQVGGNPSRTSVNLLGDVAVSNRDPGGVTKIAAVKERCAPLARVTASVVTVLKRPAPTNRVGRNWATLTANPTASAAVSAALSSGHFT